MYVYQTSLQICLQGKKVTQFRNGTDAHKLNRKSPCWVDRLDQRKYGCCGTPSTRKSSVRVICASILWDKKDSKCFGAFAEIRRLLLVCMYVAAKGAESFAFAFGLSQFLLICHSFARKCECMYVLFADARSISQPLHPATHMCGTPRFPAAIPKSKRYFAFTYHRLGKPNVHTYICINTYLVLIHTFILAMSLPLPPDWCVYIIFRSIEISFHANTERLKAIFAENSLSKLSETDFSKQKMIRKKWGWCVIFRWYVKIQNAFQSKQ